MSRYTITPWRTQRDLLKVRQHLYLLDSNGADSRRQSVERVMAWKLRGNLPHAVESTALLVEAILHHQIETNSTFSVRAVYSAAFCRFVTGFCDIGRHKERTLEPSSMLDIAKQIDMPAGFVALRHEATHEELPNLQRLVTATQQALDWLWRVYWSRLEQPDDPAAVHAASPAVREQATKVIRDFGKSRRDALRTGTVTSPDDESSRVLNFCIQTCKSSPQPVAAALVEERLIVPSNRELGSSLEGAYLIWDDLLRKVSDYARGFREAFVTTLLRNLTKHTSTDQQYDVEKEALAMWLLHVLDDLALSGSGGKRSTAVLIEVMQWCCLHPGHWTQRVGSELLQRESADFKVDWEDLFHASFIAESSSDIGAMDVDNDSGSAAFPLDDTVPGTHEDQPKDGVARGWIKAIAPIAHPIGVVA